MRIGEHGPPSPAPPGLSTLPTRQSQRPRGRQKTFMGADALRRDRGIMTDWSCPGVQTPKGHPVRGGLLADRIVMRERVRFALGRSGGDRLSRVLRHSTIGAGAFHGRVRDGIGCWARRSGYQTGATQFFWHSGSQGAATAGASFGKHVFSRLCRVSRTRITGAIKSVGRLVPVGSTRHRACTPGLSTWSSSTALKGGLVLRGVSRLDAFSGYPVRT